MQGLCNQKCTDDADDYDYHDDTTTSTSLGSSHYGLSYQNCADDANDNGDHGIMVMATVKMVDHPHHIINHHHHPHNCNPG